MRLGYTVVPKGVWRVLRLLHYNDAIPTSDVRVASYEKMIMDWNRWLGRLWKWNISGTNHPLPRQTECEARSSGFKNTNISKSYIPVVLRSNYLYYIILYYIILYYIILWTTPDSRNTPSTTNLEEEETVDAPGNDGNASMPEQVERPNPWRKMMMIILYYIFNKQSYINLEKFRDDCMIFYCV